MQVFSWRVGSAVLLISLALGAAVAAGVARMAQMPATAGLNPALRLHDLRHTAATIAVAAGESVLFVQAQLGHADVRTTQRYAHADHQAHRAAAARVAAFRNLAGTTAR